MIWSFQDLFAMFWSSCATIVLLGIQSKNVSRSRYISAALVAAVVTASQFVFVKYAMTGSYVALAVLMFGAVSGIVALIYMRDNFRSKRKKNKGTVMTSELEKQKQKSKGLLR